MKKDNSKFQKQASLLVFWLQFVFSNNHSKSTGSPLREAEVKAVKVVNFVAMWLNLYPHTVLTHTLLQDTINESYAYVNRSVISERIQV